MEARRENGEKVAFLTTSLEKLRGKVIKLSSKLHKIGRDDPRRVFHSLKVGLALTLVSIFYYVSPLFNGVGASAMWAVLTVVVVMEYTVGGTLSKGLNRTFATLLAGALGLGAHHLAVLSGEKGEPILLALFVFLLAAAATFSRFVPEIKARYDYGVTIFILTFSLVTVSSYRVEELVQLAHQRLSTIAIGVATCICTTTFVFPVWAGEDLHNLVAANLDKLANFLEGLGAECFGDKKGSENLKDKPFLQAYKSVLNSKPTEESLANFARWEPGHARFSFRHPWGLYLKVGSLTRQCACSMDALAAAATALSSSPPPATESELRLRIRSACLEMSSECEKALKELASSIRTMTSPSPGAHRHLANALAAAAKLKGAVPAEAAAAAGAPLPEVLRPAAAATLLAQVVRSAGEVGAAVDELARAAGFAKAEATAHKAAVKPAAEGESLPSSPHVAIDVKG